MNHYSGMGGSEEQNYRLSSITEGGYSGGNSGSDALNDSCIPSGTKQQKWQQVGHNMRRRRNWYV